ncbi:hypothetical protein EAF00_011087 [Botryotinia globosa]|nr:hypothetical protein EAF00_011087 [Botryotinia globosa]
MRTGNEGFRVWVRCKGQLLKRFFGRQAVSMAKSRQQLEENRDYREFFRTWPPPHLILFLVSKSSPELKMCFPTCYLPVFDNDQRQDEAPAPPQILFSPNIVFVTSLQLYVRIGSVYNVLCGSETMAGFEKRSRMKIASSVVKQNSRGLRADQQMIFGGSRWLSRGRGSAEYFLLSLKEITIGPGQSLTAI